MEAEPGKIDENQTDSNRVTKGHTAIKAATQRLLDDRGVKLNINQAEDFIRDKPIVWIGIAAAAGFIVGGGLVTRPGVALFFLMGRKMAGEITSNLVLGAIRAGRRGLEQTKLVPSHIQQRRGCLL